MHRVDRRFGCLLADVLAAEVAANGAGDTTEKCANRRTDAAAQGSASAASKHPGLGPGPRASPAADEAARVLGMGFDAVVTGDLAGAIPLFDIVGLAAANTDINGNASHSRNFPCRGQL